MVSALPAPPPTPETWAACREAVALGLPLAEAARAYHLSYEAVRKRAQRESWPTASRLPVPAVPMPVPAAQIVGEDWQTKGEALRRKLYALTSTALDNATPSPLTRWDDIDRAARIAERAAGLEKQAQNTVQIAFPDAFSGDSQGYVQFSDQ